MEFGGEIGVVSGESRPGGGFHAPHGWCPWGACFFHRRRLWQEFRGFMNAKRVRECSWECMAREWGGGVKFTRFTSFQQGTRQILKTLSKFCGIPSSVAPISL